MGFERVCQLIKSYFTIKGGSISLFADSREILFPANGLHFQSLFTSTIDLPLEECPYSPPLTQAGLKTFYAFGTNGSMCNVFVRTTSQDNPGICVAAS